MIGILLFTHGALCDALRDEAERLSGRRDGVTCLSMVGGETVESLTDRVRRVVDALDQGDGVLALVDVVGGTPWNVCGRLQEDMHIRRIGGGGLPVVIKALADHGEHDDLDLWVEELAAYSLSRVRAG